MSTNEGTITRPVLLTTPQSADYLGLRPSTLEQWRWQGRGPAYLKVGHRVRYRDSDLMEWLESRRRTSTSDIGDQAS